jgi:hypothetical protein
LSPAEPDEDKLRQFARTLLDNGIDIKWKELRGMKIKASTRGASRMPTVKRKRAEPVPDFISGLPGNPEVREVPLSEINFQDKTFQIRTHLS